MAQAPVTGELGFRPLRHDDLPMLHAWLEQPHVAEWWSPIPTVAELTTDYTPLIRESSRDRAWIVTLDDRDVGFIQSYVAVDSHGESFWLVETPDGTCLLMYADRRSPE